MFIGTAELAFHIPWVQSLKEKRMIVRSLIERTRNRFQASVAEVAENDSHKRFVIGIACVSALNNHAREMIDEIVRYVENETDADMTDAAIDVLEF